MSLGRYSILSVLCCSLVIFSAAGSATALEPINKTWSGLAIKGYDPVAYFEQGQPVKGDKRFSHKWQGATWRFASREHMQKFKADPQAYAPQYGGYCAWAVSQGKTANIDPRLWHIREGKLYLNYNKKIQARWEKDITGYIQKADIFWPKLLEGNK